MVGITGKYLVNILFDRLLQSFLVDIVPICCLARQYSQMVASFIQIIGMILMKFYSTIFIFMLIIMHFNQRVNFAMSN